MPPKWVGFWQKIPKHGSHFCPPKSLNVGPFFLKITKIFWVRNASPENFQKIPKHGSIFSAKSLNMGTFFTSKHGLGSRGPGGTPPSKPKSSTPPGTGIHLRCKICHRASYTRESQKVPATIFFLFTWVYLYKGAVSTSSMNLCLSCHVTWTVLHAWLHYGISKKTMHFGHC